MSISDRVATASAPLAFSAVIAVGFLVAVAVYRQGTLPASVLAGTAATGALAFLRQLMVDRRTSLAEAAEAARRAEARSWVADWLETETWQLGPTGWKDVLWKLEQVGGIDPFRDLFQDEDRLRLISRIQPIELVCWLDELSDSQKSARALAWERRRSAQSEADRAANAARKRARLNANPSAQPTPEQLAKRAQAKHERREQLARDRAARDAAAEVELRRRGAEAKAAYRRGTAH